MISAALALMIVAAAPTVYEVPDPEATQISIQAVAKLPPLEPREMALLRVLTRTVTAGTTDFVRRDMIGLTLGGSRPRCTLMPDHVRVELAVAPSGLKGGLSLLESLLLSATLREEAVTTATEAVLRRQPGYWEAALWGIDIPYTAPRKDEIRTLYRRVFHPQRFVLGVGGRFGAGEAQAEWRRRAAAWPAEPADTARRAPAPLPALRVTPGGATVLELRAAAVSGSDAALPARLLTLFALGSGKGSSMHRVLREKNHWSYQQESVLWPEAEGWRPRLVFAIAPSEEAPKMIELARTELLEDAKGWSERHRLRALGMAEAALLRGLEVHPLWLSVYGPVDRSLADRTFLAAYWPMKTGTPWNAARLVEQMRKVTLEELKETATKMLTEAQPVVLPAAP